MSEKTHFKKAFNSPYLGSQDLPDYKDINLVIERVELQQSKGLKENSNFNIAYFTDVTKKPMLLNATNSKILSKLAGSVYIDDWVNIEVTLTVKKVSAFGDIHDALRIREVTRKVQKNLPVLNEKSKKWLEIVKKVFEGAERETLSNFYQVSDDIWNKLVSTGKEIEKERIELEKQQSQKEIENQKKLKDEQKKAIEDNIEKNFLKDGNQENK